jgi:hypothetical protein
MSAFDKDAANKPGAADLITEDFLGHLVGDGKKFNDHESLAKGKYESDLHVSNLERQLVELREDLDQGTKITELMDLVREQNKPKPVEDPTKTPVVPGDTSSGQMTEEELKALIATHVSERDKHSHETRNLVEADKALETKYGEAAGRVLAHRAGQLGMSVEEMKTAASINPKVFYRLMGMDGDNKSTDTGTFTGGAQRSEGVELKGADTRNSAFYSKMRKEKKGNYYSPKVQMQMMKDAEALGEAFYSNS